jgi:hypothetical protein
MYRFLTLIVLIFPACIAASGKVAGGAALEDIVPMQKVKRPKLKEP